MLHPGGDSPALRLLPRAVRQLILPLRVDTKSTCQEGPNADMKHHFQVSK